MDNVITLDETKVKILKRLKLIPAFIDATSNVDYGVWNVMFKCNMILFSLVSKRVRSERIIDGLVTEFMVEITQVIPVISEYKQIRLAIYYTELLNTIGSICLIDEQYEACSNIKKFGDIYFKINSLDDEE